MTLIVTSADGFISRLIQQSSQAASNRVSASRPASVSRQDQASISQQARQAPQQAGNQQLESRLIDLYNQKGKSIF